jgi:hypothetical protein
VFGEKESVVFYNDNYGAQKLAYIILYFITEIKHADICHHFICDSVENRHVNLLYMPTEDMAADVLQIARLST